METAVLMAATLSSFGCPIEQVLKTGRADFKDVEVNSGNTVDSTTRLALISGNGGKSPVTL